jgi:hypothetical protein
MEIEKKLLILQSVYAAALADSVLRMGQAGILDRVTAKKRQEQMLTGKMRAQQFGVTKPEEVFLKLSEIFDCAHWKIQPAEKGFVAENEVCKLCAMAKKMGAQSPCSIHCLDPMEGMIKGLNPDLKFEVKDTLWTGTKCRVEVS